MRFSQRFQDVRTGFERPFWVANVSEIFERISYYGAFASLAVYLQEKLNFSTQQTGTLTGLFGGMVWFLAIFGGAIADRLGFRRALSLAYLILAAAYFLIGSIGAPWLAPVRNSVPLIIFVGFVLMLPALGISMVKPCVVGTTARASKENVRSLGYSIYYTLVNVGGTLGPIVAFLARRSIGMENVFRVCSMSVLLMFFGVLFFYREPSRSGEQKVASVAEALTNMLTVLGNLRFMLFLLIFSGFWIVFWQEFIMLPLYIRGYVNPNSDVDLLLTFGPLAVILFQILVSYLTRGIKTFPAMTAGLLITSLAWIILAVSDLHWQISTTIQLGYFAIQVNGIPVMAVVTLFVVAIGEMTQSPRYYEYISRLAPPGQQGTYMGFAFLPIGIGSLVGGWFGGRVMHQFAEIAHQPQRVWWVISSVGILTALLLWVYDRVVKPSGREVSS